MWQQPVQQRTRRARVASALHAISFDLRDFAVYVGFLFFIVATSTMHAPCVPLGQKVSGVLLRECRRRVAQGRRGSPHDRLGAPSESPPVSGGAQAVARGREIFDSLNARWRKFKASEGSPRSIHAAGCCSGSSSQGSSLYPSETRHTFDPPGQYYAVRGFHSPMGAGSFRGATSRDVRWGGRDPAGEPSAAFRFKINSLNQRVVRYLSHTSFEGVRARSLA